MTGPTSTRRFCAFPVAVALEATGRVLPQPWLSIRSGATPPAIKIERTDSARSRESFKLYCGLSCCIKNAAGHEGMYVRMQVELVSKGHSDHSRAKALLLADSLHHQVADGPPRSTRL